MKDYEKLSRQHFNKQAEAYDENNTYMYSRNGKISCKYIADYLNDKNYNSVLDIGCGTGYLFELLNSQKDGEYVGIDLAENMIKKAKEKNIKNCIFLNGSANNLPFEDEYFDIAVCSQSFHHYPYPNDAMKAAKRVLKKGGLYIISDTGVGGIGAWIDNNFIFKFMNSGDYHTENKNGIARLMIKNGFEVILKKQIEGFIYIVIGKKV